MTMKLSKGCSLFNHKTTLLSCSCHPVVEVETPICPDDFQQELHSMQYCGMVTESDVSPFNDCLAAMDPTVLNFYKHSCTYDVCAYYLEDFANVKLAVCGNLEALARDCADHGFIVDGWRDEAGCREYRTLCMLFWSCQLNCRDGMS
mgnify:CR=1 FL=1